jgi:hypothetical protein
MAAHIFTVVVIYSNRDYRKIEVNCTNSIEAIKAALSANSVIEDVIKNAKLIVQIALELTVLH